MKSVKCSICGKRIRVTRWPSKKGMDTLRRHYKRKHGGWKRPATKDRRYKNPRKKGAAEKVLAKIAELVEPYTE